MVNNYIDRLVGKTIFINCGENNVIGELLAWDEDSLVVKMGDLECPLIFSRTAIVVFGEYLSDEEERGLK